MKYNYLSAKYLYDKGLIEDSKNICNKILENEQDNIEVIDLLVQINIKLSLFEEALKYSHKAINLKSDYILYYKHSFILYVLDNINEALEYINKSLKINQNFAESYNLRGLIFLKLNKGEKTCEDLTKAISLKNNYHEAYFNRGNYFRSIRKYKLAINDYDKAIELNPRYFNAILNKASILHELKIYEISLYNYNHLLKINPKEFKIYLYKARVLEDLSQFSNSIETLNKALKIEPNFSEALYLKGQIYFKLKEFNKALINFEKAYEVDDNIKHLSSLLIVKSYICDWNLFDKYKKKLEDKIINEESSNIPIIVPPFFDSPKLEQKAAQNYIKNLRFKIKPELPNKKEKIKLGYFSADFREHATTYLMARLFELHDKNRFELILFSFCPIRPNDEEQKRVIKSANKFIDVSNKNNFEICEEVKNLGIDIAIDLMGFANNNRFELFTSGLAPIVINYLGYPGTVGTHKIDYIIADKKLIDKKNKEFFSEKIIYLPDTYQPNDNKKIISSRKMTRKEFYLPEDKFILCSFNQTYKINLEILNVWSEILNEKKETVLWLLANDELTKNNLIKEFSKKGVDSDRIIFAKKTKVSDHLARQKLADLFLDTFPYTGHTTTSDALWAGLPVITLKGNSFASRVSASLLHAIGLEELITHSILDYKKTILHLIKNEKELLKIKKKISTNIKSKPLFNTEIYTKNLEKSYIKAYQNKLINKIEDIEF